MNYEDKKTQDLGTSCEKLFKEINNMSDTDPQFEAKQVELIRCISQAKKESRMALGGGTSPMLWGDIDSRFKKSQKNTKFSNVSFSLRNAYFGDNFKTASESLANFKTLNIHPYYKSKYDFSVVDPANKILDLGAGGGGGNMILSEIQTRIAQMQKYKADISSLTMELEEIEEQYPVDNDVKSETTTAQTLTKSQSRKMRLYGVKSEVTTQQSKKEKLIYGKLLQIKKNIKALVDEHIKFSASTLVFIMADTNSSDMNKKRATIKNLIESFNKDFANKSTVDPEPKINELKPNGEKSKTDTKENNNIFVSEMIPEYVRREVGLDIGFSFNDIRKEFNWSINYLRENYSKYFLASLDRTSWGNVNDVNKKFVYKQVGGNYVPFDIMEDFADFQTLKLKYIINNEPWPYYYSLLDLFEDFQLSVHGFKTVVISNLKEGVEDENGVKQFANKNAQDLTLPKQPFFELADGSGGAGGNFEWTKFGVKLAIDDFNLMKKLNFDWKYHQTEEVKEFMYSNAQVMQAYYNYEDRQYAGIVELLMQYPSHLLLVFLESYIPKVVKLLAGLNGGSGTGISYAVLEEFEKQAKLSLGQKPIIYTYFYQSLRGFKLNITTSNKQYDNIDLLFKSHNLSNTLTILSEDKLREFYSEIPVEEARTKLDSVGVKGATFLEQIISDKHTISLGDLKEKETNDMKDAETFSNSKSILIPFKFEFTHSEIEKVLKQSEPKVKDTFLNNQINAESLDFNNSKANLKIDEEFSLQDVLKIKKNNNIILTKYIEEKLLKLYAESFSIKKHNSIPSHLLGTIYYTEKFNNDYMSTINQTFTTHLLNSRDGGGGYSRTGQAIIPEDVSGEQRYIFEGVLALNESDSKKAIYENSLMIHDFLQRLKDEQLDSKIKSEGRDEFFESYLDEPGFEYKTPITILNKRADYFDFLPDVSFHCPYDFVKDHHKHNKTSTPSLRNKSVLDFIDIQAVKSRFNCPTMIKDLQDYNNQRVESLKTIEVPEVKEQVSQQVSQLQPEEPKKTKGVFGKLWRSLR